MNNKFKIKYKELPKKTSAGHSLIIGYIDPELEQFIQEYKEFVG